jgi:hypothetical protein
LFQHPMPCPHAPLILRNLTLTFSELNKCNLKSVSLLGSDGAFVSPCVCHSCFRVCLSVHDLHFHVLIVSGLVKFPLLLNKMLLLNLCDHFHNFTACTIYLIWSSDHLHLVILLLFQSIVQMYDIWQKITQWFRLKTKKKETQNISSSSSHKNIIVLLPGYNATLLLIAARPS